MYRLRRTAMIILIAAVIAGGLYYVNHKSQASKIMSNLTADAGALFHKETSVLTAADKSMVTPAPSTASISQSNLQYYFPRGGQAPEPVLISMINGAKSSLDIAIYSFTDTDIADAVISAKRRGVSVRVISDRECSQNSSQARVLNELKSAGIPVKLNTHTGLMHLKVTIADKSVVTTGSFNYTKSAENENDEVFVVLNSKQAARNFDSQFARMWNDASKFSAY